MARTDWPSQKRRTPFPAFSSPTAPEPEGLADRPLEPSAAGWQDTGSGSLTVLPYDAVGADGGTVMRATARSDAAARGPSPRSAPAADALSYDVRESADPAATLLASSGRAGRSSRSARSPAR
jgi:hypothetical protein